MQALKSSYDDEKVFRESETRKLRRKLDHLQTRLDKAYEDRLDGVIDDGFWSDLSSRWRTEQNQVQNQLSRLEHADRDYVDQGSKILELAQHAHSLYVTQCGPEKRRLLNCLLSNCTIDGLTLYPTYRKPFDLIAEGVKMSKEYPRQDSNLLPSA